MAITRLQQARQMYALGQRVGFQGGGSDIRRQLLQFGEQEQVQEQPTVTAPVFREREFEIKQAGTTNLRLATVIEGGSRYKVLMPYQGMHTELISGNGDKSNTDLNFVQQWIYHSQNRGLGSQAPYYRSGASRQTATDGKYYYKRLSAVDLPYNKNYIDVLYNNQTPPIKK